MSSKSLILIINLIILLVLSSTFTHSAPLIEQNIEPLIVDSLTEQDNDHLIDLLVEQDLLIKQDIVSFCQNETDKSCCPLLAHRIASQHHTRAASTVLVNKSGYNVTLLASSLIDGRWITSNNHNDIDINCKPQTDPLLNGQSQAFSSIASHFLGEV